MSEGESGREREREGERKREVVWRATSSRPVWSFPLFLESGYAAMECHGDRRPWWYTSTGAKDTMSSTVKPVKELHECDVGQPTAACQVMVCPSRRTLVTKGGAKGTEERVCGEQCSPVSLGQSRRQVPWSSRCVRSDLRKSQIATAPL